MINKLFQEIDFSILNSPDFKEDSVREEIILPILKELGYSAFGENKIVRSKSLAHPFVKIGSTKRKINITPDYLLLVQNNYKWVLDAKAPNEKIRTSHHVEQVYSYAIHPDIRVKLYALCNGREFIVFKIDESEPLLHFPIPEINRFWSKFVGLLSPQAFNQIEPTEIVQSLFTQLDAQRAEFTKREEFYKKQIAALTQKPDDNFWSKFVDSLSLQAFNQIEFTEIVQVLFTRLDAQRAEFTKREEFYKKQIAALSQKPDDNKYCPTIDDAIQQLTQGNLEIAEALFTKILEDQVAIAHAANREAATAARYLGTLAFDSMPLS
jgi:hypothetical protein